MSETRKPSQRGGGRPDKGPRRSGAPGYGPRGQGPRGARPPRAPEADPARDRAYAALARQTQRFPDLQLDALETSGLDARDAAFAHAIYDVVMRRWLLLRWLAEGSLTREWRLCPPNVRAALLGGMAQILFLDRVPNHAAVNESVQWVKSHGGLRASSAVNAVLRRVASLVDPAERTEDAGPLIREQWTDRRDEIPLADGTALSLNAPILPGDTLERLSVVTSHPKVLLQSWTKSLSIAEMRRIALHDLVSPPTILNTMHATAPLPESVRAHTLPGHHVYSGTHADLSTLLRDRRDIWAQDPASSLAVQSVGDLAPKLIVDACAGKGTKTRQLAATFPDAEIVATDVDLVRFGELERVFGGDDRVRTMRYEDLIELANSVDLVLLDVPCSNTGVLARRVEARYRFDEGRMRTLTDTQRQIMADSIRLLRRTDGAGILYTTCALDPEENQLQGKWVGRWHDLDVLRERSHLPQGGPGESPDRYTDGSFHMLVG